MLKNTLIVIGILLSVQMCIAQYTQVTIDEWIEKIPYDNPSKGDSILIWADQLESIAKQAEYQRGVNYADRFRAYYFHFNGDISKATELYLEFLKSSQKIKHREDELSAISDLVYTYMSTDQNIKAKPLLTKVINGAKEIEIDDKQLSSFYNNLGILYKRNEKLDSAAWSYSQSLGIKERIGDEKGLVNLRINLSSLYIKLGNYPKAIQLAEDNLELIADEGSQSDIVYSLINRAAGLYETDRLSQAEADALEAVSIAEKSKDINLIQVSTSSLSSLYQKSGQYEKANKYLLESQEIKSKIFNEQSNIRIAELRESYEAEKREQENRLLTAEVEVQKSRLKVYAISMIGLMLLLGVLAWFWNIYKNKNRLLEEQNTQIQNQNQKLTFLNAEKNNLMSMVSHDLSTPFSTIKIWAQGLQENSSSSDITETKETIIQLSDQALTSIAKVLTIDNEEIDKLELSSVMLRDVIDKVVSEHKLIAEEKEIVINCDVRPDDLHMMTDAGLLSRVLHNLLSNGIKYSNKQSVIMVSAEQDADMIIIKVKDQGIGIGIEDQKSLFNRYTTGAIKPTNGESSHGLGLSIVQRLVDELGGLVSVRSQLGEGSTFIVRLPV